MQPWVDDASRGQVGSVKGTHERFADPVVFVVEDVAVPIKQIGEELPQVIVIRLLKKIQPPHIAQVGGHLFCTKRYYTVKSAPL